MLYTKLKYRCKIGNSSVQKWGIKGKSDYPCRPSSTMERQQLLEVETSFKTSKTTLKRPQLQGMV